jgi:hypothetical protein
MLGNTHPHNTLVTAQNLEHVRFAMRAEHCHVTEPTRTGGKAAARRNERAAAPALSPMALEAEAKARAAEAELLAMLDLEEPEAVAGGVSSSSGKGKGKAKGKANVRGGK